MHFNELNNKVTVIIPFYNRNYSLRSSIESVLNQTYKNIDIIVINDGSKFNNLELDIFNNYVSIKSISFINLKNNYGVSTARNIGIIYTLFPEIFFDINNNNITNKEIFLKNIVILNKRIIEISDLNLFNIDYILSNIKNDYKNLKLKEAENNFISFLDSDDLFLPNKIEEQINFMINSQYLISHTNEFWYRVNKFVNQNKHNEKYGGNILEKILDICRVSPSSLMIRNDVFFNIGLFDSKLRVCEDYDLSLRFSYHYKVGYLNKLLIIKRAIEENSLSKNIKFIESIRLEILNNYYENYLEKVKEPKNSKLSIIIKDEINRKRNIVNRGLEKKS